MPKQQPDYPVLIPYSQLCDLLEASQQVKEFRAEVKRCYDQVLAMRIIQQECMEKIRELEKLI